MRAPKAVACKVVRMVLARASCAWKVGCESAMAGGLGVQCLRRALALAVVRSVHEVGSAPLGETTKRARPQADHLHHRPQ